MKKLLACLLFLCAVYGPCLGSGVVTSCYDDWLAYEGSCYHFGPTAAHFTEGEHYCRQHRNSHLVHIETADENTFIKQHLQTLKPQTWWMGLTDEDLEGTWTWFDTHNKANFTDWGSNQPGRDGEEDCCVFWLGFNFRWGDIPCSNNYAPICEMKSTNYEEIIG